VQEQIEEKQPIMEVEINIDERIAEKCYIYNKESPRDIAAKIATKYNLNKDERILILKQLRQHF
jgi:hypothetical protein